MKVSIDDGFSLAEKRRQINMGWASGTDIVIKSWKAVRDYIPREKKAEVLAEFIEAFEFADWDTQDEIIGIFPEAEAALKKLHPSWFTED